MSPTPKCFRKEYFEAIVQIRPAKQEIISFVENQFNKNGIYVSKIVQHKTGIDYFISSQKFAQQLLKKLKKSFKGKASTSTTLHTYNRVTSKDVHRVTVLFKAE